MAIVLLFSWPTIGFGKGSECRQAGESYAFPGSVSQLRPICSTLLACEALRSERLPGNGPDELSLWLDRNHSARERMACDAAKDCIREAIALVKSTAADAPEANVLFHPGWRDNAWVRELADPLAIDVTADPTPANTSAQPLAGGTGQAYCARGGTKNHLRRPLNDRLQVALEFSRRVYGRQCDSLTGCLATLGKGAEQWQQELDLVDQATQPEREAMLAQAAGTLAIEKQLGAQNEALMAQRDALEEHGVALAQAEQIGALTIGNAIVDSLQTDKTPEALKELAKSEGATSAQQLLNLADATMLLANATKEVAESNRTVSRSLESGLGEIANAVLIAAGMQKESAGGVTRQIDPEGDFDKIYPRASKLGYAILLVPDPRIPRHRRGYDLTLSAVSKGMLEDGFVLDRYAVPWQKYLDDIGNGSKADGANSAAGDDGRYGVLIFRNDRYRAQSDPAQTWTDLRVLYVVAESGTYGVQQNALVRALLKIERTLLQAHQRKDGVPTPGNCDAIAADSYESATQVESKHQRLHYYGSYFDDATWESGREERRCKGHQQHTLIIGPSFSGSLSSIADARSSALEQLDYGGLTTASDIARFRSESRKLQEASLVETQESDAQSELRSRMIKLLALHTSDGRLTRDDLSDLKQLIGAAPKDTKQAWSKLEEVLGEQKKWTCYANVRNTLSDAGKKIWPEDKTEALPIRLISATTTAASNYQSHNLDPYLDHHSLAVPDNLKLKALDERFEQSCGQGPCANRDVVIFSEASTFGAGLCTGGSVEPICARAYEIPFPANIADIRSGARQRQRQAEKDALDALGLPSEDSTLDLAQGAENGSEFPDSQRSALTTASAERELTRALRHVSALNPRLVVVAATDVRDRLFLFDKLRQAAPRALLVDMEADVLMSHPSIIHATRGMLLLSSGKLEDLGQCKGASCGTVRFDNFVNDDQWALAQIIRGLSKAEKPAEFRVHGYTPSRAGLKWVRQFDRGDEKSPRADVEWFRLFVLVLIPVALWVGQWRLRALLGPAEFVARINDGRFRRLWPIALGTVILTVILIRAAFAIDPGDQLPWIFTLTLGSGFSYGWSVSIALTALFGLVFLEWLQRRYRQISAELGKRSSNRPAIAADLSEVKRFLPGADVISWPLYGAVAVLLWIVVGSANNTTCITCWPRTSLLPWGAELVILLLVAGLSAWALVAAVNAFKVFRQLLAAAHRLQTLVLRSGKESLGCWSALPPLHMRFEHEPHDNEQTLKAIPLKNGSRPTWFHPRFASTPFMARPGDYAWPFAAMNPKGEATVEDLGGTLSQLNEGFVDSLETRLGIGLFFAAMIAHIRCSIFALVVACVAVVAIGYAYPVTDRDQYLMFALCLLALTSVFVGHVVLALERLPMVSRLLCNTPSGMSLDWPTVVSIASPVLVLLAVLFVIEIPGVLGWSGGLLSQLTGLIGF